MDFPAEALVARALVAMRMSPSRYYALCRIYSSTLAKPTIQDLCDELEVSKASVQGLIRGMMDDGLVARERVSGTLHLTDHGGGVFLLALGCTIMPPPPTLHYLTHETERKLRTIHGRSARIWTIQQMKRLLAVATPAKFRKLLLEFGIKQTTWGNQVFRTSPLDDPHDAVEDGSPDETLVDVTKGADAGEVVAPGVRFLDKLTFGSPPKRATAGRYRWFTKSGHLVTNRPRKKPEGFGKRKKRQDAK